MWEKFDHQAVFFTQTLQKNHGLITISCVQPKIAASGRIRCGVTSQYTKRLQIKEENRVSEDQSDLCKVLRELA